jgi:hypothetical protein
MSFYVPNDEKDHSTHWFIVGLDSLGFSGAVLLRKDKKSLRSDETVEINVLLTIFDW